MDQIVSGEEDHDIDIEKGGDFNETQEEIRTSLVSSEEEKSEDVLDRVWSGRLSFDGSEKIVDDDLVSPLMGDEKRRGRNSQSLDLSDRKFDNVKFKKTRNPSKPPRPPKGSSLSENDQKLMREIAELAMRKRARIERMKTLRKLKAAKSSSPCSSVFAMIVTVIFFVFLIFQGFFTSNASLNSDNSPAPTVAADNRIVSVQFFNEFAPRERIDPSPTTSFRYKRVSGADNEETREKLPDEFLLGFL